MPERNGSVVVLGASAGGVDALARVVADLPADLGAAVNAFLSVVSRSLAENRLAPVTIELSDRTYMLGESTDTQQPVG